MVMKTHKGILTVCICIFLSSMCIYKDIISHLYEISKSLIKNMHINSVHTRTEHTCAHKHPSFPPTHTTSVLMSFSSGEDKSKGASPSSQKNQLLLHELLRCLPSVSLQKKKKESLFNVPSPSILFAFTL